jgi:pyruvate/2-oxoglutarate dehydrogenase complex dihydrolipoamide dehydrogenase (E3) component
MFAAGRQPNVKGLGLEEAGVAYSERDGIYADNYMRTTNSNIFAVGDCLAMATKAPKPGQELPEDQRGPGY